jgi:hypothetical protein
MNNKHDFPWEAIAAIGRTLESNASKYGMKAAWRSIEIDEHLAHAYKHIMLWTMGDRTEPHLDHALTRTAMAIALQEGDFNGHTHKM